MPEQWEIDLLNAAKSVYAKHKRTMDKQVIDTANAFLRTGEPLTSHTAYVMILNDGMFDPWFDAPDKTYLKLMEENGNCGPDVDFISKTWQSVLGGIPKFKAIVDKLHQIDEEGL
jgi:hypothetical protein